jgi:hypothetical protein
MGVSAMVNMLPGSWIKIAHPQLWMCLGCKRAGSVPVAEGDSLHLVAMRVQDAHRAGLLHICSDENVRTVNLDPDAAIEHLEQSVAFWVAKYSMTAKALLREQTCAARAAREFRLLYTFLHRYEFALDGLQLGPQLEDRTVIDLDTGAIDAFIAAARQLEVEDATQREEEP